MINSRAKGNRAEREVLKILKAKYGGEPWERKSMGIPGPDLLTPDDFPYAVEIKHDKRVRCKHLFSGHSVLEGFWKQAVTQASALGKKPLLIVKAEGIWFASNDTGWGQGDWKTLKHWLLLN